MSQSRLTACSLVLPALLAVVSGCNFPLFNRANLSRQVTLTAPHVEGAGVEVVTENGAVVVTAEEREDVQLIASLRSHSQQRLDAARVHAERYPDGTLHISAEWPEGRQPHEQFHVRMLIPDANGVSLKSRNGSLNLTGLSGPAELKTMSGSVRVVNHQGPIEARTSNGRIKIAGIGGHLIDAETSNGGIEIDGASGEMSAKTSNGSIEISLPASASGPITARTNNGAVNLAVGRDFVGSLSVSNTIGELQIDEGLEDLTKSRTKHNAELVWNAEGPESFASTTNGALTVRLSEQ